MVKETDFYDILGVTPDATEKEIRSAFRKGALKYHSDKNNSPEAAAEYEKLSKAREVLTDKEKRAIYDEYGEAGLENGAGGHGPDGAGMSDIFSQFFGGMPGGGGFGRPRGPTKPRAMYHVYEVSLEDIYKGKTAKMLLRRSILCKACQASGSRSGNRTKCTSCNGHGIKIVTRQVGPMIQRMETTCSVCDGEGKTVPENDVCRTCNGFRTISGEKTIHLVITPGVESGTKIVFEGEGDEVPNADVAADVIFEIKEKDHARFRRNGSSLHYKCPIDLVTALTGGTIYVQHLDDRWIELEIIPGDVISPGMMKVVRGQGMPKPGGSFGDMYIEFDVVFPRTLSGPDGGSMPQESITALRKILPRSVPPQSTPKKSATKEAHDLEDLDPTRDGRRENLSEDMDDDDDTRHRVGCPPS